MKIEYIFAAFALLGIIDCIIGNKMKLGEEFERGINMMSPLIIPMSGMLILAPVIANALSSVLIPVVTVLGMDISVVGTFFPNDAGGAAIAYELSDNTVIRAFNGIIVASMFGANVTLIPLSLKLVEEQYHDDVLSGLLCGLATIPVGCIVSGFIIGMNFIEIILNLMPSVVLSVLICIGLAKAPRLIRKILDAVGKLIFIFMIFGLGVGILHKLTGIELLPGLAPIDETFVIIGNIAIILAGVFPLLSVISRVFKKLFSKFGKLIRVNDTAVLGFVTNLANTIPVFSMMNEMDKKGRMLNMAFAVSAGYAFGDHLAFTLSYDGAFAMPMVAGKLISGVAAVLLAMLIYKREEKK